MMKLKLIALMTSILTSAYACEFEGSDAASVASPLFLQRHEILSSLEPIEILIPRGTFAFTGWYITTIEEYFHNVVTPTLNGMLTSDRLTSLEINYDDINRALESLRITLMMEGYKKAFDVAIKMKMDNAFDAHMIEESCRIGSLLTLTHYQTGTLSLPYSVRSVPLAEAQLTYDSDSETSEIDESNQSGDIILYERDNQIDELSDNPF